jgi:meso-butanediol dehydrogenase / (S,S)-butanediol dehydrogenase / diacetyl reductase
MADTETSDAQTPRPVALVAGAGGAIGRAAAVELAATGFDVCVTDLERSDLAPTQAGVESAGGNCRRYVCDVTNPDQVEATVAEIFADAGRVDVLVNSAGIVHVDDLLDLTFDTWRRVMSVNADGTFLMGQATARAMVKQPLSAPFGRRGMIINISSAAAEVGPPTRAAYAASKAVVKHLTMTQALALKDHAIAACVIYPGEVIEGMLRSIFVDIAEAAGRSVEQVIDQAKRDQPTGQFQSANQVGQRVAFLANSTGMRFTGTVLWCDSHLDPVPPS